MFWTGDDVASVTITAEQASSWQALMGRPPLVWDNFPVNDFARWRLFLGPVLGRASDLPLSTTGILSNPMNEAHASMIPLATLAEYVRDPRGYEPGRALQQALERLYGPAADLLEPFLEVYGDYWWDTNLFEPLFMPGAPMDRAAIARGIAELERALTRLDSAAVTVPNFEPLVAELRPFVTRTAERLAEVERDPQYVLRDGVIDYRVELDRMDVSPLASAPSVDGRIAEWPQSAWRPTYGASAGTERPRVTLGSHGDTLYVALHVPGGARAEGGNRIGERDHVAIIIPGESERPQTGLERDDLVLLLAPPAAGAGHAEWVGRLDVHGFMSKFLADNRNLTWSEFLLTSLGIRDTAAALGIRRAVGTTRSGYAVEVAIPRVRAGTRLSLTVAQSGANGRRLTSLSRRNYPANPATYVELIFPGRN
jgi:hypothetical protein